MFLVPSTLHQRLEKSSKVTLTHTMEQHTFKFVNNCLNTSIYSYLEISGGQSSNLFLNVVNFFNTSVNLTSVAASDSCFPALVSNMPCFITTRLAG